MMKTISCSIPHSISNYEIEFYPGLLQEAKKLANSLKVFGVKFAIITHDTIASLYGHSLCKSLLAQGLEVHLFSFPNGEKNKTRETKEKLEDQLFAKEFGKDSCIIALGGGVVTDIAGYLAATYCRGVSLVMIPTTLLGMVDASIGGKTGINVPHGKNLVGCIYQPRKVWIDPNTLLSLPLNELKNGVVEMIKHGLIADPLYFEFLEKSVEELFSPQIIEKAILESCKIKLTIVQEDEKDKGKRHLLNFGHTVGHALEKISNYAISHGEAVAIGILIEGHLAVQMQKLSSACLERILKLFIRYGLALELPTNFSTTIILEAMVLDKKSCKGVPRFVILKEIGYPETFNSQYCTHVDESLLKNAFQWMSDALCRH